MLDKGVISRRLLPTILLLAASAGFKSSAIAQRYEGRELVEARLVADTNAITPGKTFTAGLLLHMAPGWHTYWRYPGDAGIPTEIKWHLPAGWKIGPIQWPIPLKLNESGDILVYGYHDEVLLMQQITPPATFSGETVALKADARWLVCEKICIPGGATVQLDLPVTGSSAPANEELFARYRRSLPQSWPDAKVAVAQWQRSGSDLLLTIKSAVLAHYPAVDFFPTPKGNTIVGHPRMEKRAEDRVALRIPLDGSDQNISSLNGIVVFGRAQNGAERNAWSLASATPQIAAAGPAPASTGLARFLLFGFLGGFILNLMPCVLPVISLKIFGFVRHAGQSRARILRSGLAFIAGIFVWFIGLAVVLIALKSAGREITWAVQFTNPYFVLAMSAVVLVFALNLFGVFEISLPETANRGLLGWTAREGDAGAFFQGVFATILATPCTAPFLGPALGFAFTQSALVILLMFVAIAAGMSAPYFLLSAQPAWLRFLPKPGPWMLHVKQLMGFLLLATFLFLVSVLGAERGLSAVIWSCAFFLVVSLACWMKGAFVTPAASVPARVITWALIFLFLAGSGFYFIGRKFQAAQLPTAQLALEGGWQPFTPARLEAERKAGHDVFVDFTAAWCLTCKFNEATVLENAEVRAAFQQAGITKLKADWTNADPVITKILKQFGRPGVPLYVLYPADPAAEPFVFPELLTKEIVLSKIQNQSPNVAAQ
jgi:thiol:disulfide interchange protein